MRRSASEIIRNLEKRVANLESSYSPAMKEISKQMEMLKSLYMGGVLTKSDYDRYVSDLLVKVDALEARAEAYKARAEAYNDPNAPKVGDILYESSSYGMTLVDFYKVIQVSKSGKSVTIQKLEKKIVEGDRLAGYVMPTRQMDRREQPIKNKRVKPWQSGKGYSIKLSTYATAYKWDGEKKYFNSLD